MSTFDESAHAEWVRRIRGEYLESPGLRLTKAQVQRLWGLDPLTCERLLEALLNARFLKLTRAGAYVRSDGGPVRATGRHVEAAA